MTSRKIEKVIVAAFGEWLPACRVAAKELSSMISPDLTTIPDKTLYAEAARRRAAKRSYTLKPSKDSEQAEQRRKKRERMRTYRAKKS